MQPTVRRRRSVFGAAVGLVALAIGTAEVVYALRVEPITFDAAQYLIMARAIERDGLFGYTSEFARYRTYGYPLFVRLVAWPWGLADQATVRWAVFHAQLALLLCAAATAGVVFRRLSGRVGFGFTVFALIVLHPIVVTHTLSLTSDASAAALSLLAIMLALPGTATRRAAGAFGILALLLASTATMVRPVNLVVLVTVGIVLLVRAHHGDLGWRAVALGLVAATLPVVPQVLANGRIAPGFHPLLLDDLYGNQSRWGMELLKYATAVAPEHAGGIPYRNPFYDGHETMWAFLSTAPASLAATLALHLFGMLDHDHAFIYATDLHPWYRWPLAIANYAALALAAGGIARCWSCWRRRQRVDAFAALLFIATAYVAVHLPTAVESRFGLIVTMLLAPFVAAGIDHLRGSRTRALLGSLALMLVFIGGASTVSAWLQRQAPVLTRLALPEPSATRPAATPSAVSAASGP